MLRARGFSLIEVVITMAIVGIALMAAIPVFNGWAQNMQIRSAADSAQNGLQNARAEALRRNTTVRFQLTTTVDNSCAISTGQSTWVVNLGSSTTNDPAAGCGATISPTVNQYSTTGSPFILQRSEANGSPNVTVASNGVAASMIIVFGALGQVVYPATDSQFDFTNPNAGTCSTSTVSGVTCMRINVSVNGRIRMCNPAVASGSPQGC